MTSAGMAVAGLFVITAVLYVIYRQLRMRQGKNSTDAREELDAASTPPPDRHRGPSLDLCGEAAGVLIEACEPSANESKAEGELDLQLLRFLSEGTTGGLSRQIDLYLAAFESDRCHARTIFATNDPKQIHRMAHRLIAHAGAVHCLPLHTLATTMQAESAQLRPEELEQLMTAFDREFAVLTKKLDALRGSTGPA